MIKTRLYINDKVLTKHGVARVKSIDLYNEFAMEGDAIEVKSIWTNLLDKCVIDMDNGHWAYGEQVELQ